jgi:hypothetical protein
MPSSKLVFLGSFREQREVETAGSSAQKSPSTGGASGNTFGLFGVYYEWHLDFANAFRHITFHLGAWLCQPVVVTTSPLFHTGLVAIGAISDTVGDDGIE